MYRRTRPFLLAAVVILSLLLSACGGEPSTATPVPPAPTSTVPPTATVPPATPTAASTPTPSAKTPQQIAHDLRPATVWVKSTFGETAIAPEGIGAGTGIVFDVDNGYILTNAHVVEGASAIQVYPANSTQGRPARVLGRAECDDLAVLKLDDTTGLVAAPLGDSSKLEPGAAVVALGYPQAFERGNDLTVSAGVVSKLHAQMDQYEDLVQTDARITHGNSGGPLVNDRGEVIGVNTLGFVDSSGQGEEGINFAIAMSYARPIIKDLETGRNRNYLGLNLYPNLPDFKQYFGTDDGLVLAGVASGSPADQAGLRPADLLLKVEGKSISYHDSSGTRIKQVCDILRSHADGDPLRITVQRLQPAVYMEGEVAIGKGGSGTSKLAEIGAVNGGNTGVSTGGTNNAGGQGSNNSSDLTVVVETRFSSGDAGTWPLQKGQGYSESVANGLYTVNITTAGLSVAASPKESADMTDGLVSASAKAVGVGWVGVVARYSISGDQSSMYFCGVSADSKFFCSKRAGGQWTNLVDATGDPVIKARDFNVLTLVATGNKLQFIVNDKTLGTYTDGSLSSGAYGVLASTDGDSTAFQGLYEEVLVARPK